MTRSTRTVAGAVLAAGLVVGTLATSTLDHGATLARWEAVPESTFTTPTVTTGSLGIDETELTITTSQLVARFVGNAYEMYELDAFDSDTITLTTQATPVIEGTGLQGAVVAATYSWPVVSNISGWNGLDFTYTAAVVGSSDTVQPRRTGDITTAGTGATLEVLVLPTDAPLPQGWADDNTIRYTGSPPTVSFSLTVHNRDHGYNFILGGPNTWTVIPWTLIYYPSAPSVGTAVLSVRQINSDGIRGAWSYQEGIQLPVIFNASDSRTGGVEYDISTTAIASAEANPPTELRDASTAEPEAQSNEETSDQEISTDERDPNADTPQPSGNADTTEDSDPEAGPE